MNKTDMKQAVLDFMEAASLAGYTMQEEMFKLEFCLPPHETQTLPIGKMAVYGFWYQDEVLKIGLVGPNSNARFNSQHYNPKSSQSNLASSVLKDFDYWKDIVSLNQFDKSWMKTNFGRFNIFIDASHPKTILALLEAFLHVRFKPRYER